MSKIRCHICGEVITDFNVWNYCAHLINKHKINWFNDDPEEIMSLIIDLQPKKAK